jgi:hypothetical protein
LPRSIQFGARGIGQEVVVIGNGKALETRRVHIAFDRRMIVGMVPLGLRGRDPAQHASHQSILGGPQNHVPVIWHQGKREQLDEIAFQAFAQRAEESPVVIVLVRNDL